jgi:hypothetical protein
MVQSNHKTDYLCCFRPFWNHLGTLKWTQKGKQRPASAWDIWLKCLSLKIIPNQVIRPILLEEMVQNNQKTWFLYAVVFFHFGAILRPPNRPKKVLNSLQVGRMYGLMSNLKIRALAKSLGPLFYGKWSKTIKKKFFLCSLWPFEGHLGTQKDTQGPTTPQPWNPR